MLLFLGSHVLSQVPVKPQFTKENVSGLHLSLNDPSRIEEFFFEATGNVIVTIGQKNGPATGPILQWKISNGKLLIFDNAGRTVDELVLITMDSSKAVVQRSSGQNEVFTITNPVEKKLRSLFIKRIDFHSLDIATVLNYLTVESKTIDPDHVGIKFLLRLPPTNSSVGRTYGRDISMMLDEVSLADILLDISSQTNLDYKIEGDEVIFYPHLAGK